MLLLLVASLLLVAMHFVPSSFLLQVVRPGAPSSVLAPSSVQDRFQFESMPFAFSNACFGHCRRHSQQPGAAQHGVRQDQGAANSTREAQPLPLRLTSGLQPSSVLAPSSDFSFQALWSFNQIQTALARFAASKLQGEASASNTERALLGPTSEKNEWNAEAVRGRQIRATNRCHATRNRCQATSNKCLTSRNKKLFIIIITSKGIY